MQNQLKFELIGPNRQQNQKKIHQQMLFTILTCSIDRTSYIVGM